MYFILHVVTISVSSSSVSSRGKGRGKFSGLTAAEMESVTVDRSNQVFLQYNQDFGYSAIVRVLALVNLYAAVNPKPFLYQALIAILL